jgi:hypothetical protein
MLPIERVANFSKVGNPFSLARDGQEYFAGVQYRPLAVSVLL